MCPKGVTMCFAFRSFLLWICFGFPVSDLAFRLPQEGRPFTTVENPLQIHPFYAKRTQFPESPNERKVISDNAL